MYDQLFLFSQIRSKEIKQPQPILKKREKLTSKGFFSSSLPSPDWPKHTEDGAETQASLF